MTGADSVTQDRVSAILDAHVQEIHGLIHDVPPHEVYEVTVEGQRAICKIGTGATADPETEARVIEYVAKETALPVPTILDVGRDYFLAEWLDGVPSGSVSATPTWCRVAGRAMARLHEKTGFSQHGRPVIGTDGLEIQTQETWAETVLDLLRRRRDDLAAAGHVTDARTAERVRGVIRDKPSLVGDGAPVLCHGNILPDHLGVSQDSPTGLIDFEHALVAPAAYDYYRTGLPLFQKDDGTRIEAFREGYQAVRPVPESVSRYARSYRVINGVSYLRALHVQRAVPDDERQEQAADFRARIDEELRALTSGD